MIDSVEEGRLILDVLRKNLPTQWDGRECVLQLKAADYNWRQMEWIGWYFEWKGRVILVAQIGGREGPRYGRTKIDYFRQHAWDLKVHPVNGGSRWAILNDVEAVDRCLQDQKGMGFLVACGTAIYDDPGRREFQAWHVAEAGGKSTYTIRRESEGRPSRLRKRGFSLQEIVGFFFRNDKEVQRALNEGWLRDTFQKGMRNAGGSPRRAKYSVCLESLERWARL